jgi:hypothetical protein
LMILKVQMIYIRDSGLRRKPKRISNSHCEKRREMWTQILSTIFRWKRCICLWVISRASGALSPAMGRIILPLRKSNSIHCSRLKHQKCL